MRRFRMFLEAIANYLVVASVFGVFVSADISAQRAPEDTVAFELFTWKNPTTAQILLPGNQTLFNQSNFNISLPTKIHAHGFTGGPGESYNARNAYLQKENVNFIGVDWSILAAGDMGYEYVARNNVPVAGTVLGALVDFLVDQGADVKSFHLMGFSMGAHVVAVAGWAVTRGKIPRISGLDPAAYIFQSLEAAYQLDTNDAEFVDVVHTSSVASLNPIGHVDFYPNGGIQQPGCPDPDTGCCNHCRVLYLFAESINTQIGFRSVQCGSYSQFLNGECTGNNSTLMGNLVPNSVRGTYYLYTNDASPYAQG